MIKSESIKNILQNNSITESKQEKILGVKINYKPTYYFHIDETFNKADKK